MITGGLVLNFDSLQRSWLIWSLPWASRPPGRLANGAAAVEDLVALPARSWACWSWRVGMFAASTRGPSTGPTGKLRT